MPEHTPSRKAFCAVAVTALIFAAPRVAHADVFNITFTDWFPSTPPASRTFTGLASGSPESLNGFVNDVFCTAGLKGGCVPGSLGDPAVDMSNGDPNPQIHFTIGQTFSFSITPTSNAFDLVNDDPIHPAEAFDFTTPFDVNDPLNGAFFTCGGNAFPGCGFQVAGSSLAIRFSGSPEPATLWLLLAAAGGIAVGWRKLPRRA